MSGTFHSAAVRVLLVDDHLSMLWGLERLVQSASQAMEVVGTASNGREALAVLERATPDVILLDIDLGQESGLELIPQLLARCEAKIIILTGVRDQAQHDAAVLAGARGVLQKEASGETILKAIARVQEGQIWLDRASTGRIFMELARRPGTGARDPEASKIASLTERERKIVALCSSLAGAPAKQIASRLFISEHTLRNHLTSIYKKLDVANRLELLSYAQKKGLDRMDV